jgi:hypothetical protein
MNRSSFNQYLSLLLIIILCVVNVNCTCDKKATVENMNFQLVVSKMYMDPNNNDIRVGGGGWGGDVVIRINNNPVKINSYGGILFEISHWVKPGRNLLSFNGMTSVDLYYKILTTGIDNKSRKILAAGVVKPTDINEYNKIFSISAEYLPVFYRSDEFAKDKNNEIQIIEKIKRLHEMLTNNDENLFVKTISKGPRIWCKKRGSCDLISIKEENIRKTFFNNSILKVKGLDISNLKLVWGQQSVLVYEGFDYPDSNLRDPYLFQFEESDGSKKYFAPLCFVLIDNEWIAWD